LGILQRLAALIEALPLSAWVMGTLMPLMRADSFEIFVRLAAPCCLDRSTASVCLGDGNADAADAR
jgi:hypothetical protein